MKKRIFGGNLLLGENNDSKLVLDLSLLTANFKKKITQSNDKIDVEFI